MSSLPLNQRPDQPAAPAGMLRWYPKSRTRSAFPATLAGERQHQRWHNNLPAAQRRVAELGELREPQVRGDATLPDGELVFSFMQAPPLPAPPLVVVNGGTARNREKNLAVIEAVRRIDVLRREFPTLHRSGRELHRHFVERNGDWLRENRLPTGWEAWFGADGYEARVRDRKPADGRLKNGRAAEPVDPRLRLKAEEVILSQNKPCLREVEFVVAQHAAELGIAPLKYHQILKINSEICQGSKTLAHKGPRAFRMECEPKMRFDYSGPRHDCCDALVLNVWAMVVGPNGYTRISKRVVLICVIDCESGKFLSVAVRTSENADGILAGLFEAYRDFGLPVTLTIDHGRAYNNAAGGSARRLRAAGLKDGRLPGAFRQLGIQVLQPSPYTPWAKKIESHLRLFDRHLAKLLPAYCGSTPAHRSEYAKDAPRNTLEEIATFAQLAKDTINAMPRRSLGGLTPNQLFEQRNEHVRRAPIETLRVALRPVSSKAYLVGRDGVRYQGINYELEPKDLVKLQGKKVWPRPDIEQAGKILLCDQEGRPLCEAVHQKLVKYGVTCDDKRRALARKKQYRELIKKAMPSRDYVLDTKPEQLMRERRDYARAQEKLASQNLRPAPTPDVTLVRPDLAGPSPKTETGRVIQELAEKTPPPQRIEWEAEPLFKPVDELGELFQEEGRELSPWTDLNQGAAG